MILFKTGLPLNFENLENVEKALNFKMDLRNLENFENWRNLLRKTLKSYFAVVFFLNLLLLISERTKTTKNRAIKV